MPSANATSRLQRAGPRLRVALLAAGMLLWSGIAASTAAAQSCPDPCLLRGDSRSDTPDHLVALGVNMALGGLTAGIRQSVGKGSFRDGFWRGALGGAGTYAGKAIAASRITGGGAIGRGVAGVGASMTRNAADGLPTFDRLIVPLGPMRLHWRPAKGQVHASVDVLTVGVIAGAYISGIGAALDVGRTLESGAPVILARRWRSDWRWQARQIGGAVIMRGDHLADGTHDAYMARVLGHERVHVLQHDQAFILWSEPADRAVLAWLGAPPRVARSLDVSLYVPVMLVLNSAIAYESRPWEREARLLSGTH